MLIPLGILAASGTKELPTYELISTTLISSNTPSITFDVSSFASTYKHFQLRYTARTTTTSFNREGIAYRINGDSGNNYSEHGLGTDGSTPVSGATTSFNRGFIGTAATNAQSAGIYSAGVVDILDPYAAKNKVLRTMAGRIGSSPQTVIFNSSMYINTAPISSIFIAPSDFFSFVAGSRFSLYGIRG